MTLCNTMGSDGFGVVKGRFPATLFEPSSMHSIYITSSKRRAIPQPPCNNVQQSMERSIM
jgi:hypothetical protein